jgi:hypothetical protein
LMKVNFVRNYKTDVKLNMVILGYVNMK